MSESPNIPSTSKPEIEALRVRLRQGSLRQEDLQLLDRLLGTLLNLIGLLQQKNASLSRLKRMLFGPRTDLRSGERGKAEPSSSQEQTPSSSAPEKDDSPRSMAQNKKPGHGQLRASAYSGARVMRCRDSVLQPGDRCPDPHCRGHLYDTGSPAILIQLTGQPIVGATKYEQEVLRCSACQHRYTAPLPDGVKAEKLTKFRLDVSLSPSGARLRALTRDSGRTALLGLCHLDVKERRGNTRLKLLTPSSLRLIHCSLRRLIRGKV
jgi:hypothetical protein